MPWGYDALILEFAGKQWGKSSKKGVKNFTICQFYHYGFTGYVKWNISFFWQNSAVQKYPLKSSFCLTAPGDSFILNCQCWSVAVERRVTAWVIKILTNHIPSWKHIWPIREEHSHHLYAVIQWLSTQGRAANVLRPPVFSFGRLWCDPSCDLDPALICSWASLCWECEDDSLKHISLRIN